MRKIIAYINYQAKLNVLGSEVICFGEEEVVSITLPLEFDDDKSSHE